MNDTEGVYRGSVHCLRETLRAEGVAALWKGWLPTWMRMAPWSLTFFVTFDQLREMAGLEGF